MGFKRSKCDSNYSKNERQKDRQTDKQTNIPKRETDRQIGSLKEGRAMGIEEGGFRWWAEGLERWIQACSSTSILSFFAGLISCSLRIKHLSNFLQLTFQLTSNYPKHLVSFPVFTTFSFIFSTSLISSDLTLSHFPTIFINDVKKQRQASFNCLIAAQTNDKIVIRRSVPNIYKNFKLISKIFHPAAKHNESSAKQPNRFN